MAYPREHPTRANHRALPGKGGCIGFPELFRGLLEPGEEIDRFQAAHSSGFWPGLMIFSYTNEPIRAPRMGARI